MKQSLKVAALQLNSGPDVYQNIQSILSLLMQVPSDADLVVLPENSLFFQMTGEERKTKVYSLEDGQIWGEFEKWVADHPEMALVFGGVPLNEQGLRHNAVVWLTKGKKPQSKYQKIHLFDVEVEGQSFKESESFAPGVKPQWIDYKGWRIGLSVCYDLRFSTLYDFYAQNDVDMILIPSSFLDYTGKAHWHVLNRARAIETQCYVISPAQVGWHIEGDEKERPMAIL